MLTKEKVLAYKKRRDDAIKVSTLPDDIIDDWLAMRVALEFYGEILNYTSLDKQKYKSHIEMDEGAKAREVLE